MSKAILETDIQTNIDSFRISHPLIHDIQYSIDDGVQYISVQILIRFTEGSSINLKVFPNFIQNVLKTAYNFNKNPNPKAMTEKDVYNIALDFNNLMEKSIQDFYIRTKQLV